jgi:Na+/melibiose symporter-like transporter
MYFVYMLGVMLIFPCILCLFVLWRVEEPVTEDPGEQQASCALDHFLPNNVFLYHLFMHRLILMGPNRSP